MYYENISYQARRKYLINLVNIVPAIKDPRSTQGRGKLNELFVWRLEEQIGSTDYEDM